MDVNKFRGAWGYDVDSVEFVRELRKGSKRKKIYIQEVTEDGNQDRSSIPVKNNE